MLYAGLSSNINSAIAVDSVMARNDPAQSHVTLLQPVDRSDRHYNHHQQQQQLQQQQQQQQLLQQQQQQCLEQEQEEARLAEHQHPNPSVTVHHYPSWNPDVLKDLYQASIAVSATPQPFQTHHAQQQHQNQQQPPLFYATRRDALAQHLPYGPTQPTCPAETINGHEQPMQHYLWHEHQEQEHRQHHGHHTYCTPSCPSAVSVAPVSCRHQSGASAITAQQLPSTVWPQVQSDVTLAVERSFEVVSDPIITAHEMLDQGLDTEPQVNYRTFTF